MEKTHKAEKQNIPQYDDNGDDNIDNNGNVENRGGLIPEGGDGNLGMQTYL